MTEEIEVVEGFALWQVVLRYSLGGVQLAYRNIGGDKWLLCPPGLLTWDTANFEYGIVKKCNQHTLLNEAAARREESREVRQGLFFAQYGGMKPGVLYPWAGGEPPFDRNMVVTATHRDGQQSTKKVGEFRWHEWLHKLNATGFMDHIIHFEVKETQP